MFAIQYTIAASALVLQVGRLRETTLRTFTDAQSRLQGDDLDGTSRLHPRVVLGTCAMASTAPRRRSTLPSPQQLAYLGQDAPP